MDHTNKNGQRKAGINGNWIKNHSPAFLCCLLKCCPRNRKGTSERATANRGRTAPHGPIPPLSSLQIADTTPRGLKPCFSEVSIWTTYSSATIPANITRASICRLFKPEDENYGQLGRCQSGTIILVISHLD